MKTEMNLQEREAELVMRIKALKEAKNAVILAHYYTRPEVQQIADYTGDSLALSQMAAKCDADILVFAGVYFMAETAKILSPNKKVLVPDPEAGCSLADSCRGEELEAFLKGYPNHKVVAYVNTTAEVKALTDICCTSSNAVSVIRSIPRDQPIVFAPDRNLGSYLQKQADRPDMVLWNGACHVHEEFSVEGIIALKKQYPEAKVLAHPECKQSVLLTADVVGSTAALLSYATTSEVQQFIVVTESGILHQMQQDNPTKEFFAAPPIDSTCGCNDCAYMKLVTLEKIAEVLENETNEVFVEESLRERALGSITNMLAISGK